MAEIMSLPCRITLVRFLRLHHFICDVIGKKNDSYGFKLCALIIMTAELRFYLRCVDFRSGLAPWVAV